MSSTELVVGYLGERARPRVFVPLSLLVAATAWFIAPGSAWDALGFAVCGARALLLTLALRIWDDLQDRPRDALRDPDRVTVRARSTAPLMWLGTTLAAGATMTLVGAAVPLRRISILGAVVLGLLVWYRARPAEPSHLASAVLLAKYPALAILLAPGLGDFSPARAAISAGALYTIVCAYEFLEDRSRGMS